VINFYLYNSLTGEIVASGCLPQKSDLGLQDREDFVAEEGRADPEIQYVDLADLSVKDKEQNPTSISGNTLSNLPLPCTISIRGASYQSIRVETEITLDLYSDIAGKHKIKVTPDNPKYYTANFSAYLEPKE